MGFLIIIALLAVGYLLYKNNDQIPSALKIDNGKAPIDIINERYARGEIDRNEYERLKQELQ